MTPAERRSFKLAKSLHHRNIVCLYGCEQIRPCSLQRSVEVSIPCHSSVTSVKQNKVNTVKITENNCAVEESRGLVDENNRVEHEVIVGSSLPLAPPQTAELPMNCCERGSRKSSENKSLAVTNTDCYPSMKPTDVIATERSVKSVEEMLDANENFCGLDECDIVNIIRDMAAVMSYLKQKCVVHKNIRPENISLCIDKNTYDFVYKLDGFNHAIRNSPIGTVSAEENSTVKRGSQSQESFTVSFQRSDLPHLTRTIYKICTGRFALSHPLPMPCRGVTAPDEGVKDWLNQGLSQNYKLSPRINTMLYDILLDLVDSQTDEEKFSTFLKHVHKLEALIQVHICHIESAKCTSVYVAKDAKVESLHHEIMKETGLTELCILTPDMLPVDLSKQICPISDFLKSVDVSSENPLVVVASNDESQQNNGLLDASNFSNLQNHDHAKGGVLIKQEPTFAEMVGGHVSRVMSMVQSSHNKLRNIPRMSTVVNQAYSQLKVEVGYMQRSCFQCNKRCFNVIHELQGTMGFIHNIQSMFYNCLFTEGFAYFFELKVNRIMNFFQKQQTLLNIFLKHFDDTFQIIDPKKIHSFTSKIKSVAEQSFKRARYEQDSILSTEKHIIQCKDGGKASHNDCQFIKTIEHRENQVTKQQTEVTSSHEKLYNKITEHMNAYKEMYQIFNDMLENLYSFEEYIVQTLGSMNIHIFNQLITK